MRATEKGFTLLEMLLSILILGIIAASAVPFAGRWLPHADLEASVNKVAQNIRLAQARAEAMYGDQQWGVRVLASSVVLFKGSSYATRDTTVDETTSLSSAITAGGTGEIVFSKLDAKPTPASSSITLTSAPINEVRTITVNAAGAVAF